MIIAILLGLILVILLVSAFNKSARGAADSINKLSQTIEKNEERWLGNTARFADKLRAWGLKLQEIGRRKI